MQYKVNDKLTNFSHTVRVLFVTEKNSTENIIDNLYFFFSNIDVASSYDEALDKFNNSKYDLIITTINLDTKDGICFVTNIRTTSKHITILLFSQSTDNQNFAELIRLGIDGFILKPIQIQQFSDVMDKTIEKLKDKQELYEYRLHLEKKVNEQVEKLREKDNVLLQQSKLAAMGEMIDAVAHQWKQPLNIINLNMDMLKYDFEDNRVDKEYCDNLYKDILEQSNHMQTTLDEFRTFLRPDKATADFSIADTIEKVLLLIKDELLKYQIEIVKDLDYSLTINGIENEFKHLILNFISNSKDAYIENKTKNRIINFKVYEKDQDFICLEVSDKAGGIPKHIINDIFKSNVTSKEKSKGTGIGLYMSQQIVQKQLGTMTVQNVDNGALFKVILKK